MSQEIIDYLVGNNICSKRTAETALSELLEEGKIDHTNTRPSIYFISDSEKIPQTANTNIDYGVAESQKGLEEKQ